jgi:hypothetical protein
MRFEIPSAVVMMMLVFCVTSLHRVDLYVGTNVSKERTASIFRAEGDTTQKTNLIAYFPCSIHETDVYES